MDQSDRSTTVHPSVYITPNIKNQRWRFNVRNKWIPLKQGSSENDVRSDIYNWSESINFETAVTQTDVALTKVFFEVY